MEPKSLMWTLAPPKIMPSSMPSILAGENTGIEVTSRVSTHAAETLECTKYVQKLQLSNHASSKDIRSCIRVSPMPLWPLQIFYRVLLSKLYKQCPLSFCYKIIIHVLLLLLRNTAIFCDITKNTLERAGIMTHLCSCCVACTTC